MSASFDVDDLHFEAYAVRRDALLTTSPSPGLAGCCGWAARVGMRGCGPSPRRVRQWLLTLLGSLPRRGPHHRQVARLAVGGWLGWRMAELALSLGQIQLGRFISNVCGYLWMQKAGARGFSFHWFSKMHCYSKFLNVDQSKLKHGCCLLKIYRLGLARTLCYCLLKIHRLGIYHKHSRVPAVCAPGVFALQLSF